MAKVTPPNPRRTGASCAAKGWALQVSRGEPRMMMSDAAHIIPVSDSVCHNCFLVIDGKTKVFFYHLSCSSFDPSPLCFQALTVAVATCSVASTGTQTSTTVPMITRPRLLPRSVKRTPWWWPTRSREYRSDEKTSVAATMTTPLTKTGVWVWTFWNEHWHEWLSEDWKDSIYKITTSRDGEGGKKKMKWSCPREMHEWSVFSFFWLIH